VGNSKRESNWAGGGQGANSVERKKAGRGYLKDPKGGGSGFSTSDNPDGDLSRALLGYRVIPQDNPVSCS